LLRSAIPQPGNNGRAAVHEPARAKLNLYLHVTGRRDDGYHLLDSLVAFAEAGDMIVAAPGGMLSLAVDGPFAAALGGEPDNLVMRAARALAAATGAKGNAALTLTKNLPVASGIGGGSADAAATLRVLCRLWNVRPPRDALDAIAVKLGADVPVCLDGVASFIGGVGERRYAAPRLPAAGLVLVNPGTALPTPAVFGKRSGPFSEPARFTAAPRDVADLAAVLRARHNDLTDAATALVPAIRDVMAALDASLGCLLARMSGSGATCFGLYPDRSAATAAAASIAGRNGSWWVLPTAISTAQPGE
jgi:4-diphosphocytidyl-2-C-methyl-D-erythritol kinase